MPDDLHTHHDAEAMLGRQPPRDDGALSWRTYGDADASGTYERAAGSFGFWRLRVVGEQVSVSHAPNKRARKLGRPDDWAFAFRVPGGLDEAQRKAQQTEDHWRYLDRTGLLRPRLSSPGDAGAGRESDERRAEVWAGSSRGVDHA